MQQVAWNPVEPTVLATASFDRTASVLDARAADQRRTALYALTGEPECLVWNHLLAATFIVATDDGKVACYDCRVPDSPLWRIQAHDQAVTSVALSATADGLMATASLDKSVRLWDIASLPAAGSASAASVVRPLSRKAMAIGQLFSCAFNPDSPFLLAAGGSKGMLAVWDIAEDGGEGASGGGRDGAEEENVVLATFEGRVRTRDSVPSLTIRPRADGQPLA